MHFLTSSLSASYNGFIRPKHNYWWETPPLPNNSFLAIKGNQCLPHHLLNFGLPWKLSIKDEPQELHIFDRSESRVCNEWREASRILYLLVYKTSSDLFGLTPKSLLSAQLATTLRYPNYITPKIFFLKDIGPHDGASAIYLQHPADQATYV